MTKSREFEKILTYGKHWDERRESWLQEKKSRSLYLLIVDRKPSGQYDCESWTVKKAESRRIDAFELQCWRRLLRVPWTDSKEIKPVDQREINPEYSLEVLMLELKRQYFGHLRWTAGSLEKSLMLGKIECRRRRSHHRKKWLDGITSAMDMNLGKLREMLRDREAWCATVHGMAKSRTWLGDWTTREEKLVWWKTLTGRDVETSTYTEFPTL